MKVFVFVLKFAYRKYIYTTLHVHVSEIINLVIVHGKLHLNEMYIYKHKSSNLLVLHTGTRRIKFHKIHVHLHVHKNTCTKVHVPQYIYMSMNASYLTLAFVFQSFN